MAKSTVHIRALAAGDRERWNELWQGYLEFYKCTLPADITELTWRRLLDPAHPFQGLVAVTGADRVDGIVHFHLHGSTWARVAIGGGGLFGIFLQNRKNAQICPIQFASHGTKSQELTGS